MAIKHEYYKTRNDGVVLFKTYSDTNKHVKQVETNRVYLVAIDVYPIKYTYVEVEKEETKATFTLPNMFKGN